MPMTRLTDRSVIAVRGTEAQSFLQGLITNDMGRLDTQPAIYAALLTPQGKVLIDFLVVRDGDDGFLLDVAASQAETLLQRLKLYRLRLKIDLVDESASRAVCAIWGDAHVTAAPPGSRLYVDPRTPALGCRMIVDSDDAPADADALQDAYREHRVSLGVPDTIDVEGQFALDANFEELGGVDFRKGCFVGQEVTARMKHKAQPRKRLVPLVLDGALPAPGTKLIDGAGLEIGELLSGTGQRALASVRLERLKTAGDLAVEGTRAHLASPGYDMPVIGPLLSPA